MMMLKHRKVITDDGSRPITSGMPPLTGTTPIGHLTRRIRIMHIHQRGIIRIRGSMVDSMLRTIGITETTIRIMGTIEATTLTRMFIDGITAAVGMPRSRGVRTPTEVIGEVKIDVHGIHGV